MKVDECDNGDRRKGSEHPRPKKSFGQNFLTDNNVLSRIAQLVDTVPGGAILEVGPGRGALTRLLALNGARVVAVELDRDLVPFLRRKFQTASNVEIVEADILKTDLAALLRPRSDRLWQVAANLPYNISSPVLFLLMDNRSLFTRLVLMLQKEVGNRLVAFPDTREYGALSVLFQLHFDIKRELTVKPGSFFPVPKVDSLVLSFTPLIEPRIAVGDEEFFRKVVKAAFAQRRKTLWNCLKLLGLERGEEKITEALEICGIARERRGETLSLPEFGALARALSVSAEKGKKLE